MKRAWNFNPGPAALPLEVLERARETLVDYDGKGMSLLEMSHRSEEVERLVGQTEETLLRLIGLNSADYRVLLMAGGASAQFALVPLHFLGPGKVGRYVLSGSFSEKAYREAQTVGEAAVAATGKASGWSRLPDVSGIDLEPDTAYLHMTTNNTIEGSQFRQLPDTGGVPLIGDMTSDLLGRSLDWSRFSLFYAAAQKNLGPAGVTALVIRNDLLQSGNERIPAIFRYKTFAEHGSLYNTPPVHAIYVMKLMLDWTEAQGGVAEMERRGEEKAAILYRAIDDSDGFYRGIVEPPFRSTMNVTWRLADEALERKFADEAERGGLAGLAGHRSVGGLRASIYNAVPVEACRELAAWMNDFRRKFG
ncbi:3-phosphoserine/phosphohydroxythreonine transaminase [Cohnella zeiphila]|uniref:Phosphoserine aminotransferase n=1 Tax=Cohnella zeiphila TaxID=2761120 RepID=A0A7X0VYS3_9BACL|nr:3-phosphoserine/phosphohydroxythreonine transaminase [Cohnella zeiphila]MBB6734812.1 3-phosphoserine/phosphohydroxythreonine transaminase [Cohnella zeiphila]